ncbi:MAG: hypothetical protein AAGF11_24070 [Myxococcota bacterium]
MAEILQPVVVEVGKKKKREIRNLKSGRGRLMDEVQRTVQATVARLQADHPDKKIVPVVSVVRRKKKSEQRSKRANKMFRF